MFFFEHKENHDFHIWCGTNQCASLGSRLICNITKVLNPYSEHIHYVLEDRNVTDSQLAGSPFLDTFLVLGDTYRNVQYNFTETIYSLHCDKLHRVILNHETTINDEIIYTPGRLLSFLLTCSMFVFIMTFISQFLFVLTKGSNVKIIMFFAACASIVILSQIVMEVSDIYAMTWLDVCYGGLVGLLICIYILHLDEIYESISKTHPEQRLNEFDIEDEDAVSDYDDKIPTETTDTNKQQENEIEMREKLALKKRERKDSESEMSEVSL